MSTVNVTFNYNANVSGLLSQIKTAQNQISKFNSEIARSGGSQQKQLATANKAFLESANITRNWQASSVSLTSSTDHFAKALDRQNLKLKEYRGLWKEYRSQASGNRGMISALAKDQVRLQNSVVTSLGQDAGGKARAAVFTPKGLDLAKGSASSIAVARKELQIYNKALLDGSTAMINWGKNTQWAGRQLMVGLTLPMGIFAQTAKQTFIEVDKELTRMEKVYGSSISAVGQSTDAIREDVMDLGKTLAGEWGVALKETAGMAADIAATGKEGQDLIDSTRETMRLSVLGEVDRQDAMKATLSLQSAFKLNNEELANSINFLNAVENQTTATLGDLVEAIPKAGPVVKGLGGSVQDLAIMMVAMREGGIDAAEGANAIKSGMASLINPTKEAQEMLMGYGINLEQIVQNNKGQLMPIIMEFSRALQTMDEFSRQQAIETVFGKYQFARIGALFANLGAEGSQTIKVMDLMGASTEELAAVADSEMKKLTESISMRWQRAVESIKAQLVPIGEVITQIMTWVVEVGSKLLELFNNLPDPIKTTVIGLGALVALVGPIIMMTGVLGNFVGYFVKFAALIRGRQGGIFQLLSKEMIATSVAGKQLTESTFNEDVALKQLNGEMIKHMGVLDSIIAKTNAASAAQQGMAESSKAAAGAAAATGAAAAATGAAAVAESGAGARLSSAMYAAQYAKASQSMTFAPGGAYSGTRGEVWDKAAPVAGQIKEALATEVEQAVARGAMGGRDIAVTSPDVIKQISSGVAQRMAGSGLTAAQSDDIVRGLLGAKLESGVTTRTQQTDIDAKSQRGLMDEAAMHLAAKRGISAREFYGEELAFGHTVSAKNMESRTLAGIAQPVAENAALSHRNMDPEMLIRNLRRDASTAALMPLVAAIQQEGASTAVMPQVKGWSKMDARMEAAANRLEKEGRVSEAAAIRSAVEEAQRGAVPASGLGSGTDKAIARQRDKIESDFKKQSTEAQKSLKSASDKLSKAATVIHGDRKYRVATDASGKRMLVDEAGQTVKAAKGRPVKQMLDAALPGVLAAEQDVADAKRAVAAASARRDARLESVNKAVERGVAEDRKHAAKTRTSAARRQRVLDHAAAIEEDAAKTKQSAAERALQRERKSGALGRFTGSAAARGMGIGMGAAAVGALTGNEALTQAGAVISSLGMAAFGVQALGDAAVGAKKGMATLAASIAARGGIAGALAALSGGIMGLVATLGPWAIGLAAVYGAFKLWQDHNVKEDNKGRAGSSDAELFGVQPKGFNAVKEGKTAEEAAAEKETVDALKGSDRFKEQVDYLNGGWFQEVSDAEIEQYFVTKLAAVTKYAGEDNARLYIKTLADEIGQGGIASKVLAGQSGMSPFGGKQFKKDFAEWDSGTKDLSRKESIDTLTAQRVAAQKALDKLESSPGIKKDDVSQDDWVAATQALSNIESQLEKFKNDADLIISDIVPSELETQLKTIGSSFGDVFNFAPNAQVAMTEMASTIDDLDLENINGAAFEDLKNGIKDTNPELYKVIANTTDMNSLLKTIPREIGIRVDMTGFTSREVLDFLAGIGSVASATSTYITDITKKLDEDIVDVEAQAQATADEIKDAADAATSAIEKNIKAQDKANKAQNKAWDAQKKALDKKIKGEEDEIEVIEKRIDVINEEYDARDKALQQAKEAADFARDQRQLDLDYQTALASGDYAGAAGIALQREQGAADYAQSQTGEALQNERDSKVKIEEDKITVHETVIEGYQAEIDAINEVQDAANEAYSEWKDQQQERIDTIRENADAEIAAVEAAAAARSAAASTDAAAVKASVASQLADIQAVINQGGDASAAIAELTTNVTNQLTALGWTQDDASRYAQDLANGLTNTWKGAWAEAFGIDPTQVLDSYTRAKGTSTYDRWTTWKDSLNPLQKAAVGALTGTYHDGGSVTGETPAGLKPGEVSAVLQTGEFVMRRKAVKAIGQDKLQYANDNLVFHNGGSVEGRGGGAFTGRVPQIGAMSLFAMKGMANTAFQSVSGNMLKTAVNDLKDAVLGGTYAGAAGDDGIQVENFALPSGEGSMRARQVAATALADGLNEIGYCLRQVREWWSLPGKYGDANAAWAHAKKRNTSDTPPVGAPVFWGGSEHGHVALSLGSGLVRSTDAAGLGRVGTRPLSYFTNNWGLKYNGWTGDLNDVALPLRKGGKIRFDNTLASLHRGETVLTEPLTAKLGDAIKMAAMKPPRTEASAPTNSKIDNSVYNIHVTAQTNADANDIAHHIFRLQRDMQAKHGWSS